MPDVSTFVERNKERAANPKSSMHSLELVLTVIIFVAVGRFIDSQLDTLPVFTILMGALGAAGSFASAYFRYQQTSKKLDEGKAWTREATPTPVPMVEEDDPGLVVPKGYGND